MGRPKGSKDIAPRNTPARKAAVLAASEGVTPLDVMLRAMRAHVEGGNLDAAAAIAKDAAPYVHARLAAVQHTGPEGGPVQLAHVTIDRPPPETREEWLARRQRELGVHVVAA